MRLLIDENVPHSIVEFLRQRGHEVTLVSESLGRGTPDSVIARVGDEHELIVVTFDPDLKSLASRLSRGERAFRRLGRISFRCEESRGLGRLMDVIDSIEFEYAQLRRRGDKRLIVEITATTFVIVR